MNKLIRFEPFLGAYVLMEGNEFYMISEGNLQEVCEEYSRHTIIKNVDNPDNVYSMPLKVQIQTTDICNLKCVTCAVANENCSAVKGDALSDKDIFKTLDSLASHGVLDIEWSGGEPLTRKSFLNFSEHAANLGMSQNLLTNGTLFNEDNMEVIKNNFFRVQISLDGVGSTYDEIVGKKAWKGFVNSVKLIDESVLPKVVIATVLQKANVEKIEAILQFCALHSLPRIRISMQVPIGRSSIITWHEYSSIIDLFRDRWPKLKADAERLGIKLDSFLEKEICDDSSVPDVGYIVSPYGFSFLYIDAFGDIFPFPFLTSSELKLGSVRSDDLRDVWFKSDVLNYLRKQTYKNTGCGECRFECSFAERSLVYAYTGSLSSPALYNKECKERRW